MPKRLQRKRTKGSRLPKGAIVVTRPGPLGNPFAAGAPANNVRNFERWLDGELSRSRSDLEPARQELLSLLPTLADHDLACWCPLCDEHADGLPLGVQCDKCPPCHGNVLLARANLTRRDGA